MSSTTNKDLLTSAPKGVTTEKQYREFLKGLGINYDCWLVLNTIEYRSQTFDSYSLNPKVVQTLLMFQLIFATDDRNYQTVLIGLTSKGESMMALIRTLRDSDINRSKKQKIVKSLDIDDYLDDTKKCEDDYSSDHSNKLKSSYKTYSTKNTEYMMNMVGQPFPSSSNALAPLLSTESSSSLDLSFSINLNRDGLLETIRKIIIAFRHREERNVALETQKFDEITATNISTNLKVEKALALNVKILKKSIRGGFGYYMKELPSLPPLQIKQSKTYFKKREIQSHRRNETDFENHRKALLT